tara:strand:+ start:3922 stop:4152 length:231 start_codon:yes stop_codon:yes gene_type:complete
VSHVTEAFAMIAMLPALANAPVPRAGSDGQIVLSLCQGGQLTIDTGEGAPLPQGTSPCCAKGCRSDKRRGKLDRSQ